MRVQSAEPVTASSTAPKIASNVGRAVDLGFKEPLIASPPTIGFADLGFGRCLASLEAAGFLHGCRFKSVPTFAVFDLFDALVKCVSSGLRSSLGNGLDVTNHSGIVLGLNNLEAFDLGQLGEIESNENVPLDESVRPRSGLMPLNQGSGIGRGSGD